MPGSAGKIVAIVQARMGSTRLPGKVLMDLRGQPVLTRVVSRLRLSRLLDEVVVATTVEPRDDVLVEFCSDQGILCVRGSENDVLDRYYRAAQSRGAAVIVRVTSDCPLIDGKVVDSVVQALIAEKGCDYASNTLQRTYPRGLDVEAMHFATLRRAFEEDKNPAWREHVTPYIYYHPEAFTIRAVKGERDCSDLRWTLDTTEDLALLERIFGELKEPLAPWTDVLALCEQHPEWASINGHIAQKKVM